ncbi:MAG: primosomal protein N' family DNA-binding protein [Acidimicrobiales bacterium]
MAGTVEVLPDVTGIDRAFHYSVAEPVVLGTVVRVLLHGRRVRGWVVALGTNAPPGVEPQPIVEIVSLGPPPEVVELCRWASWRWAGRLRSLLLAASPGRVVRSVPAGLSRPPRAEGRDGTLNQAIRTALRAGDAVLRLAPGNERLPVVETTLHLALEGRSGASALVLVESREDVGRLSLWLRRSGWPVATYPEQWADTASPGRVVIGTRNAALAPLTPSVTLVLDAHSDAYRAERVPTFDAREIAAERARRCGTPVVFVTPCPSLELLARPGRRLVTLERSAERRGWGTFSLLDSRAEDPAEGGYPSSLVASVREAAAAGGLPVVCILNRVGRARLLTCGSCRQVQRCGLCGAAQVQLEQAPKGEIGMLLCPRCGDEEPAICPACGSARLRVARPGVARAAEQLGAATGLEVGEVSGPRSVVPRSPVIIGTQAALHRLHGAAMVAWLDFDQELCAPRFRAAEAALSLLARSVRLVRSTESTGRVIVRTSMPDHEVLRAAQLGDPGVVADAERSRRELLGLPPFSAMARIDGESADELVSRLPSSVEAYRLDRGWAVRASSPEELADALARLTRGEVAGWAGLEVRVEVDPLNI